MNSLFSHASKIKLFFSLIFVITFLTTQAQVTLTESLPEKDIKAFVSKKENFKQALFNDKYYVFIQLKDIPDKQYRKKLESLGVDLLATAGNQVYRASVPATMTETQLRTMDIISINKVAESHKIAPEVTEDYIPEYAVVEEGKLDVSLIFSPKTYPEDIETVLEQFNAEMLTFANNIVEARVVASEVLKLGNHPLVLQMGLIEEPAQLLNYDNVKSHRVNYIQTDLANGLGLTGEGVCVGVGDGGELGDHIDMTNRVINYADGTYSSFGSHGDHVTGTIGGAGNLDPKHAGMAPDVTFVTQKTSNIITYATDYVDDHGMVITNNSYGSTFNCSTIGTYTYSSVLIDRQAGERPELLHCVAAGNSGYGTCDPYPQGFNTVLRAYQVAKNALTVGSVDYKGVLANSSSRGPVADGRLKPEICGVGVSVMSTGRTFNYLNMSGTSMATPSVAGTIALLNEHYRNENNGELPDGALMKAIVCNTADDLGNKGIDFKHGYGLINARRAAEVITDGRFDSDTISHGEQKFFTINVPAGVEELKVMMYYADYESVSGATQTLVNNLNLRVTSPSNNHYHPWVLNPNPNNVNDLPSRGIDNLNNIEQVTLDNPQAGNYNIAVTGVNVPQPNQKFFIVYEFVKPELILTYPNGGETIQPGATEHIRWDAYNPDDKEFKIEFTEDGGQNWTTLFDHIPGTERIKTWTVPNTMTSKARVKISMLADTLVDEGNADFSLLTRVTNVTAEDYCTGKIELNWNAVSGAASYIIYRLDSTHMNVVGTSTSTSFTTDILPVGSKQWFSVQAKSATGAKSLKTIAISAIVPSTGDCPGFSDDVSVEEITVVDFGRIETSEALGWENISITIKNNGNLPVSNIPVFYSINGGTEIGETCQATIQPGQTYNFPFSGKVNMTAVGTYVFSARTALSTDTNTANDQLNNGAVSKQFPNAPISLPLTEDFEAAIGGTFDKSEMGIAGLSAFDLITDSGQLLTDGDITNKEGDHLIRLETDSVGSLSGNPMNEIIMTLNFSDYPTSQNVKLSLDYKYFSAAAHSEDQIWVRGADTDNWVLLHTFTHTFTTQTLTDLRLGNVLYSNGQEISANTQIKFVQRGEGGYAIDNLGMIATNDELPVELVEFTARKQEENNDVLVKWSTSSELNNNHFEVQVARGTSAAAAGEFETIEYVEGAGTTTEAQYYSFLDTEPQKSGVRYYRLKQVDTDGVFEYSPIVTVKFEEIQIETSVFPNPFIEHINLNIQSSTDSSFGISVLDMNGAVVYQKDVDVIEGEQIIQLDMAEALPSGFYTIKIDRGAVLSTYRVMKVTP